MKIRHSDLSLAKVLFEDDDFLTLEVVKNEERELAIERGDRFVTMLFVRRMDDGSVELWKPWS